jgi:hypothetical protein
MLIKPWYFVSSNWVGLGNRGGGQQCSEKVHDMHEIYKLLKITQNFSLIFNFIFINLN